MQAGDELGIGLNHVPGWLRFVAVSPALVSVALGLLPASVPQHLSASPRFVPYVLGGLVALGWLSLAACTARSIGEHGRLREPAYAAIDAWKVLLYGAGYYLAEGQLFPTLPALSLAQLFFTIGLLSSGLILPIFDRYTRRHVHGIAP